MIYNAALIYPPLGLISYPEVLLEAFSVLYFLAFWLDTSDFKERASLSILFLKGLSAHFVTVLDVELL
ncbi:hypothetical protein EHQ35_16620, partial [Leptospira wolffii]